MAVWPLTDIIVRRATGFYIATVMASGFVTFYSQPDAWPLLGRQATMIAIHGFTTEDPRDSIATFRTSQSSMS